ncbi:MAG: hypothetical protein ACQEVA_04190 [Myxococcota bacterium]
MKCNHCGHRYSPQSEGGSRVKPPGYLFFAGHCLLINAAILASIAILAHFIDPDVRMVMYILGELGLVAGVFAYGASVLLASAARRSTDFIPRCNKCGHGQAMRPWTI